MMKKVIVLFMISFLALPVYGQKQSKEEKEAAGKALYEMAKQCVEQKSFVIVPATYGGQMEYNNDNSNFFSAEGANFFAQGNMVCGNGYTNILEATEYDATFNKKGQMTLKIVVKGRMMNGTYIITMRNNTNEADVIFTPQNGMVRRFTGPIMPLTTSYNKRSNPM